MNKHIHQLPRNYKFKSLLLCIYIFTQMVCSAQQTDHLYPCFNNNKWGYCDQNKNVIIQGKYDNVEYFFEGFARVTLNQRKPDGTYQTEKGGAILRKTGFIDKQGKEIVPLKYDRASDFHEGLARVYLNHKYGFINAEGKEVIPLKFGSVSDFKEGIAILYENGLQGIIDSNGKELIPPKYNSIREFRDGRSIVQSNGAKGVIDKEGTEIIPVKYLDIAHLNNGTFLVAQGNKRGLFAWNGREICQVKYDAILAYEYLGSINCYIVNLDRKYRFLDTLGLEITPLAFDFLDKLYNQTGYACRLNGKFGLIDLMGKETIPFKYDTLRGYKWRNAIGVRLNGKWGLLDGLGNEITPIKYDALFDPGNGTMKVRINEMWGTIDTEGNEVGDFKKKSPYPKHVKKSPLDHYAIQGGYIFHNSIEGGILKYTSAGWFDNAHFSLGHIGLSLNGHLVANDLSYPIVGASVGGELHVVLFPAKINLVYYYRNKEHEVDVTPQIGLSVFGYINLYYGYHIPLSNHVFTEINRHSISITFNLPYRRKDGSRIHLF